MSHALRNAARNAADTLESYARDAARPLEAGEDPEQILDRIARKLERLAGLLREAADREEEGQA